MRTLLASAALVSVAFGGCARDRLPHPVGLSEAGPFDGASPRAALADSAPSSAPSWAALGVAAGPPEIEADDRGDAGTDDGNRAEDGGGADSGASPVLTCPHFDDCSAHRLADGCLIRCDLPLAWAEAAMTCMEIGGRLAVPATEGVNALLTPPEGARLWIGVSDLQQEGRFVGLGEDDAGYANWGPGEPNDAGGEDCTEVYPSGVWNDNDCALANLFACDRVPAVPAPKNG